MSNALDREHTTATAAREDIEQQLADIARWVDQYDGAVSHSAFLRSCDEVARKATLKLGIRVPVGTFGRGVLTLEFAAAICNLRVPSSLHREELPGGLKYMCEIDAIEPVML